MTLRQEVEVHEIHAESDYDEDDDGQVGGAVAVEPFENLPHHSVPPVVDVAVVLAREGLDSASLLMMW